MGLNVMGFKINLVIFPMFVLVASYGTSILAVTKVGWVSIEDLFYVENDKFHGAKAKKANCMFAGEKHQFSKFPSLKRLVFELKYNRIDVGIFLLKHPDRDQHSFYAGDTWGEFKMSLYYLRSREKELRSIKASDSKVGIRIKSIVKQLAMNAGYSNILEATTADQLLNLLDMNRIHYYFDVEDLFEKSITRIGLDPNLYSKKNIAKISPGTYFSSEYLKKFPNALEDWKRKELKCNKS